MNEESDGHVEVIRIVRDCQGCYLLHRERGCPVATWCASLVRSCEDGTLWVYSRFLNGDGEPVRVARSELSRPPRVLC